MIIRMTVNDNDFTAELEKFAENLFNRVYFGREKPEDIDCTEWYEKIYKPQQEVQKLMNPNITSTLTDEDKVVMCTAVFFAWCDYIDNLPTDAEMEDRVKEYLKKVFEVSVGFDFTDKWENGEVVYYFTTNQKWISQ